MHRHKKHWILFLAGFGIGCLCFILLYGVRILNFSYNDWLLNPGYVDDLTQHYLGWLFLRDAPWSFPLGVYNTLSYPHPVSIIYTDSIPLFAVFFKLFSPVLPGTFQYFGLFGILSFGLQGGLSALLLRRFTDKTAACLFGALFFIFSPVMLFRMYHHTALAAHWLILAALCLWMYRSHVRTLGRKLVLWGILTALGVTIELYFTPMILGIMVCSFLQELLEEHTWRSSLAAFLSSVGVLFGTMALFGGFVGGVSSQMGGFGYYSMNLNAFINPMGRSSLLPTLPVAQLGQSVESFAYLGLGMFLLLAVALGITGYRLLRRRIKAPKLSVWLPVAVMAVVFILLALSPVVTLNKATLFTSPLPQVLFNLLSTFRSSARFVWPVYYLILTYAVSMVARHFRPQIALACILAALVLQGVDLHGWLKGYHDTFSVQKAYVSPLKSPEWAAFSKKYKHIVFPSPTIILYQKLYMTFSFAIYAHTYGMTMNAFYFSRDVTGALDVDAGAKFYGLIKRVPMPDDTLYVFPQGKPKTNYHLKIKKIDGYYVGVK